MSLHIIHGNLGKDPELRTTASGKKVVNFTVAERAQKAGDPPVWHSVLAWEKTAELIAAHMQKGSEILIYGRLQFGQYDNKEGQTVKTTETVVDRFEFCGSKKKDPAAAGEPAGAVVAQATTAPSGEAISEPPPF